jgi:hypothetical protein
MCIFVCVCMCVCVNISTTLCLCSVRTPLSPHYSHRTNVTTWAATKKESPPLSHYCGTCMHMTTPILHSNPHPLKSHPQSPNPQLTLHFTTTYTTHQILHYTTLPHSPNTTLHYTIPYTNPPLTLLTLTHITLTFKLPSHSHTHTT